ncbi:MAG: hypothetical protein AABZ43_06650 [Planctomycetota bacterium]|jgi:hypothetical protein
MLDGTLTLFIKDGKYYKKRQKVPKEYRNTKGESDLSINKGLIPYG